MTDYRDGLPVALQGIYDDEVAAMHELLQAEKPADVLARRSQTEVVRATRETAAHAVVQPHLHDEQYLNPKEGIVSPYAFAIGLSRQMYTRSETTANFTGMRTLAFTNSDHEALGLMLTRRESRQVKRGNLEPVMDRYARVVETLGFETVHIAGYSQGGMMAPALAEALERKGVADVASTMAAEWPNGEKRGYLRLLLAFGDTKPADIQAAKEASQVDAFTEAASQDAGLVAYTRGMMRRPNLQLIKAMGQPTFNRYMQAYLEQSPEAHILLARASLSTILKKETFDETVEMFASAPNVRHVEVENFGHGFGDFAIGEALLVRQSIRAAAN